MDIQYEHHVTRAVMTACSYIIIIIINTKKVMPTPALLPSWDEVSPWVEVSPGVEVSPWDEVSH